MLLVSSFPFWFFLLFFTQKYSSLNAQFGYKERRDGESWWEPSGVGSESEGTQFSPVISLSLSSFLFSFLSPLTSRHTPLPERLTQAIQKEMISGARFSKVPITQFGLEPG